MRGERARGPSVTRQPSGARVREAPGKNAASAVGNHLGLSGRKEGRLVGRGAGPLMPSATQRKRPLLPIRRLLAFLIKINMFLKELTFVPCQL